jgi:hypothetical protein
MERDSLVILKTIFNSPGKLTELIESMGNIMKPAPIQSVMGKTELLKRFEENTKEQQRLLEELSKLVE